MEQVRGLSASEAEARLAKYGPNLIRPKEHHSTLSLLLSQFTDPIMLLLLAATSVSFAVGEILDSLIILMVVVPTALLSFFRERRARLELKALLDRVQPTTMVIRDGELVEVPAERVVVGDVVSLKVGSHVPADLKLLAANRLLLDESVITGESFPVERNVGSTLYLGSFVSGGEALGEVTSTGAATKYGELVVRLASADQKTSFEIGSAKFGRFLIRVMFALVASVFIINLLAERPFIDSVLFSLALAVGLTPQLLSVIITITLTRGASKMAKQKVLIKRLDAIEDIGSMTVLCSDKTGTLTKGQMQLISWKDSSNQPSRRVLELAGKNAASQTSFQNPIDIAIAEAISKQGVELGSTELLAELPYDFERRRLSVALSDPDEHDGYLLITKGAFAEVLELCAFAHLDGKQVPIAQAKQQLIAQQSQEANQGNRVLLIASKKLKSIDSLAEQENDLVAEGLLVFLDPIKPEAAQSIQTLSELGIRTVIVTGDNPLTTARVASEVGLKSEPHFVGSQVDQMTDEQLQQATKSAAFFAAVNPMQKQRIIQAMTKTEETVGFFGDGINDALALRAADVGISVENAADVAKQAADIVLLDKNLDVLSEGVKIGRASFANTMTYIRVTISANFGNVVSVVVAAAFLPFLPLLPMQILLLNLLSDIPHLAIATDRVEKEDLAKPKSWEISNLRRFMLIFGLVSSAVDILLYWVLVQIFAVEPEVFRSVWFIESLLSELVAMLVLRTKRRFWQSRPSWLLLLSCLVIASLALGMIFTAPIATVLGFAAPEPMLLLIVAGLLLVYATTNELLKKRFMV